MRGQTLRRITIGAAGPVALAVGSTAMISPAWAESGPPPANTPATEVAFRDTCNLKSFKPVEEPAGTFHVHGYAGVVCASLGEISFSATIVVKKQAVNGDWVDFSSGSYTGHAGALNHLSWYEFQNYDCSGLDVGPWNFQTSVIATSGSITRGAVSPVASIYCGLH